MTTPREAAIAEAKEQRSKDDWAWLMANQRGRRVFEELRRKTGMYADLPVVPHAECAKAIGRRSFGLWLEGRVREVASKRAIEGMRAPQLLMQAEVDFDEIPGSPYLTGTLPDDPEPDEEGDDSRPWAGDQG